jgi:hypothetical protein
VAGLVAVGLPVMLVVMPLVAGAATAVVLLALPVVAGAAPAKKTQKTASPGMPST